MKEDIIQALRIGLIVSFRLLLAFHLEGTLLSEEVKSSSTTLKE